jgi:trans-aconitate methyltransferase
MNTDLISYYKDRAKEYEKIYSKPERQDDLKRAAAILQETFAHKKLVEIACGTGYWTEKIAHTAASIFATDINEAVLEIARQKTYPNSNVTFGLADIFQYQPERNYEGLFGGFIWSHILLQDLERFIQTINGFVANTGTVVLMDNRFVEGSNLPITETDLHGNTFQSRQLEDGTTHRVLKNFPTEDFLREQLKDVATDVQVILLEYYWILIYTPVK